jgi:hypothetical protein
MNFLGGPAMPDREVEEQQILRARPAQCLGAPQDWVLPATLPVNRTLADHR